MRSSLIAFLGLMILAGVPLLTVEQAGNYLDKDRVQAAAPFFEISAGALVAAALLKLQENRPKKSR